jgi:toxin YhaV
MEIHGWRALLHPLFEQQLEKLTRQVERLKSRDPKGYAAHPATKILASLHYYIREAIPSNPDADEFHAPSSGYWLQARFHGRYRLFYRISREQRVIVYVWAWNGRDSRSGTLGAFRAMLERGDPVSITPSRRGDVHRCPAP